MDTQLFIANLAFTATEDDLLALLSECGRVKAVYMPRARESGRCFGFAFAEMGSSTEAKMAIQSIDGRDLGGRRVRVRQVEPRDARGRM